MFNNKCVDILFMCYLGLIKKFFNLKKNDLNEVLSFCVFYFVINCFFFYLGKV